MVHDIELEFTYFAEIDIKINNLEKYDSGLVLFHLMGLEKCKHYAASLSPLRKVTGTFSQSFAHSKAKQSD